MGDENVKAMIKARKQQLLSGQARPAHAGAVVDCLRERGERLEKADARANEMMVMAEALTTSCRGVASERAAPKKKDSFRNVIEHLSSFLFFLPE